MPKQQKRSSGMMDNEKRIGDEMTNDVTRLNEKMVKSKEMMTEDENVENNMEKASKKLSHLIVDKKVMIKSASEPRLLIPWQASDLADNDHEA